MSMLEISEAARVITESVDPNAKIIFGASQDDSLKKGELKVTVIATGFNNGNGIAPAQQKQVKDIKPVHRMMKDTRISDSKDVGAKFKRVEVFGDRPEQFEAKVEPIVQNEEDELDIPAFIRRKLGK